MDKLNRIFFKDNPYPKGHKIKEFVWSGRFEPETGLWFDFHLVTEDYYIEYGFLEDEENKPESAWKAAQVWRSYHNCTLSSTIKKHSPDTFDIEWKGKIALTYAGEEEFKYEFSAFIERAKFHGFDISDGLPDDLGKYVINAGRFDIRKNLISLKQH